jgi:hypothetical protein
MSAGPRNDMVEAITLTNAGALGWLYTSALVRAGNLTAGRCSRCFSYSSRVK